MSDVPGSATNWREMPAGRELDRVIAERVGWAVECHKVVYPTSSSYDYYRLIGPNGEEKRDYDIPEAAWQDAPHYSTDANAALSLPTADLYFIDLHGPHSENSLWHAFIEWGYSDEEDEYPSFRAEADTAALAVCRAWLAWKDAQA